MRSLFHFPLPCTTTLAVTVSYSNRPTAARNVPSPASCTHAPPAPLPSVAFRRPPAPPVPRLPRSGPRPTVTRSQGARHAAPPSLPRAAARSHRAPSPEYRPAAACTASPASRPPRAVARIAPTACRHPHPPMSPPSRFRAHRPPITTIVRRRRLTRVALRRPHRAHRAPTSASPPHLSPRVAAAPGPWLARTAPYASLFRRMREKGPLPGNIRPKCMLFEIKMATSSPHASISGRNRAIQDTWRANLAAKGPFPRRGARNHAWREDVASAARPFSGSGMRSGGTGFAPCGSGMRHAAWPNGLCALRRGPGLLAACAPCHLACARRRPRSSPPSYTRRASPPASRPPRAAIRRAACGRGERRSGSSCRPRAAHADASRYLRAAPIPPAARTHRVQEISGTTQTTQCGHKNRIPKWGPY